MIGPRPQRGFTLIELLIAMAVFAVMAAMAYGGLSSVIATQRAVGAALDRNKALQMALWRVRNDVEQIVARPVRDHFGDTQPPIVGSAQTGLVLTRDGWSNPLGEARSNLQRVAYRLDGHNNLLRDYWPVLDQAQDSQPVETKLLSGVKSIEWRFLDDQRQWRGRWPANLTNSGVTTPALPGATRYSLPLAIELRLDTKTWGKLRLLMMVPGAQLNAQSGIDNATGAGTNTGTGTGTGTGTQP